jgi:hypothetical protein
MTIARSKGDDANGNLTGDGTNTYAYNARNHLTAISGGSTASFVYRSVRATAEQDHSWDDHAIPVRWHESGAGAEREQRRERYVA